MATKGSNKKPTKVHEFIRLQDLPAYVQEKFDGYRLAPHSIDFCLRMAAGEDSMSIVQDLYSLGDDRAQIKRKARDLMGNPKIQDMIRIFRDNMKHQSIVDANAILMRLEILYSECVFDGDRATALKCLKQMSDIITNLDGSVSISDITIKFELPNLVRAKQQDIEDAKIEE